MNVVDRINSLLTERNLTAKEVEISAGLSNSSISQWRKGKGKPSLDAIIKLSGYFGVTSDYLLGLTDRDSSKANEEEQLLLDVFNTCSTEDRFRIIQLCMNIKEKESAEDVTA